MIIQMFIVQLIHNSIKYIPSKDYKPIQISVRRVYDATGLKVAEAESERFKQAWNHYPITTDILVRKWSHVEHYFNYDDTYLRLVQNILEHSSVEKFQ